MDNRLHALQEHPLFSSLSEQSLARQLLPLCRERSFLRDQSIFHPQERVDQIALVLSGRVHLAHLFEDGSISLMTVLGKGAVLGADLAATPSRRAPYHALAAEETQLLLMPADAILTPGSLDEVDRLILLQGLLRLVANANMKKEYRLAILSRKGLRQRILTYLTMQAAKQGRQSFSIPFSREELAAFLCVNRSALSHELSLMAEEGILRFRKNEFTLLDR